MHHLACSAPGLVLGLACAATLGHASAHAEGAGGTDLPSVTITGSHIRAIDAAGVVNIITLQELTGFSMDASDGQTRHRDDAGARRQALPTNLEPPTFTQSRSFTVLCVAAVTASLILLYQLRLRQIAARQRSRYEERLGERERIARELHDTFLQGMQGLILNVHQAAKQIDESEAAHQLLQKALEQADAVMAEGRDRILDLRIGWDSRLDLSESLAAVGHDLARGREVRFRGKVEGQARQLTSLARDEAYRIAREALLNAFEHAQAASIELQVIYGEESLRVRVRDDGMGIEADAVARGSRPGHWGLVGMRERAHGISARLDVWSKRGAGTEVELAIPAAVAYVSASRPQGWWPLRRPARCSN